MKPCSRLGINVTWRCNAACRHCFYLRDDRLHTGPEVTMAEAGSEIRRAAQDGLDHVVMIGYGEPSLAPIRRGVLELAHSLGMATSMITNAATGLRRFKDLFAWGMDHLHISSHGLDGTLDDIMHRNGIFRKQAEVKEWLATEELPFRTNVTLQQLNYRELPDLADYEIEHGDYHFVFLGFLPHYAWADHLTEIAVHPAELRPYIEDAADRLIESDTYFTIRYHPLCHLAHKYWPYVVNANHVPYDPWEWQYGSPPQRLDLEAVKQVAQSLGEMVAIQGKPCNQCSARQHCGGWNRTYADAFDGAGLTAIEGPPTEYAEVWETDGGLHDLNPANHLTGTIRSQS